jgi:hypothetical protein
MSSRSHDVAFGAVEESHESVRGMLTDMGVSDPPTFFVHALQRTLDADGIEQHWPLCVLYHGTTDVSARQILREGFRLPNQQPGDPPMRHGNALGPGVCLTKNRELAAMYGETVLTCLAILPPHHELTWRMYGEKITVRNPNFVAAIGVHGNDEAALLDNAMRNQMIYGFNMRLDAVDFLRNTRRRVDPIDLWKTRYSKTTGQIYYWNERTGQSTVSRPREVLDPQTSGAANDAVDFLRNRLVEDVLQ